ncbi:MAG TPA: HAMP domain-containing sensor histidine kinase [Gammaproteobacteria bacterium]
MLFERLRPFLRTSAWRFTLIFAAIFFVIFCAMIALIYELTIGAQKERLERDLSLVTAEITALAVAPETARTDFIRFIRERSDLATSLILALVDNNKIILGNLSSIPGDLPAFPEHRYFPVVVSDYTGEPTVRTAIGSRAETRFGSLTIALFDNNQQILESNFWGGAMVALTCALIITLVAGFIFSRYVLSRIKQIYRLTAEVKAGKLELRLPLSKRADEFDNIASQINAMLDEIDELIQSVASVTDNIAHDLRTPLSRMRLRIEESLNDTALSTEERLWRIEQMAEIDQLIDTFNAMLELTRLEKGVHNTLPGSCDLSVICSDVVELVSPLADEKNQQLILTIEPTKIFRGDRNLLFRAIYNLAENAVKYAPAGGTIRIIAKDKTVILEDNGPGIPPEETGRVFQRLYRLDKSRTDRSFGLGLSIVEAIVRLHEGSIQLSNNNPGLRVTVNFQHE